MDRSLTFSGRPPSRAKQRGGIRRLRIRFRFNQVFAAAVVVLGLVLAFTIVDSRWTWLFLGSLAADVVYIQWRLSRLDVDSFVDTAIALTVALWLLGSSTTGRVMTRLRVGGGRGLSAWPIASPRPMQICGS